MRPAPLPGDEDARIALLSSIGILDSEPEEFFDRITRLASRLLDAPMVLVCFTDGHRHWFKSRVGLDVVDTRRDGALCAHAILQDEVLIVPDALQDERFFDNPAVTGGPHIRFYAGAPLRSVDGTPLGTLCVMDRQQRSVAEQEVALLVDLAALVNQELAHRERAVQAHTGLGFQLELKGRRHVPTFKQVSTRFAELVQCTPDALSRRARLFLDAVYLADRHRLLSAITQAATSGMVRLCEFRLQRASNHTMPCYEVHAAVQCLPDGRTRMIGHLVDISERKLLEERLARLAYHDTVTGLENRVRFKEHVEKAVAPATRHGGDDAGLPAVLLVNLDNFKTINDTLGHEAGDRLLALVAQRLRQAVREPDRVARLGGDEFAVLLQYVHAPEEAASVADRIVETLHTPFMVDGHVFHVGASIGIAYLGDGDGPQELLRNANLAMYRAKREGKARHETFAPELHSTAVERFALEDDLRRAMQRPQELLLQYQPIVDMATRRVVGAEALVRWQHPHRGLIPPDTFIPVAEDSGLILPLGRWILIQACRDAARWPQWDAAVPLTVTVNISMRQVQDTALLDDVRHALEASGLPPSALVLELTERVFMRDQELMVQRLQALKALGVQIAIDDFGTGFSSLAYLQRFPIDVLKIDKSFVDTVNEGGKSTALARTIIALAEALELRSVAEGVEHPAQQQQLQQLSCRYGQGYLFAKPMSNEALSATINGSC